MPLVIRVQTTTCQLTIKEASSTAHAAIFSLESLFSITQRLREHHDRCSEVNRLQGRIMNLKEALSQRAQIDRTPGSFGLKKTALALVCFLVILVNFDSTCGAVHAQMSIAGTPIAPAEMIQRVVRQNEVRASRLTYYTSRRNYHVDFHGLGRTISADMHLQATYNQSTGETFEVIDESGSHLLLNCVLRELLESEKDDSRQLQAAFTPSNHTFIFQTETNAFGERLYVFAVQPKGTYKRLYRGTNGKDTVLPKRARQLL